MPMRQRFPHERVRQEHKDERERPRRHGRQGYQRRRLARRAAAIRGPAADHRYRASNRWSKIRIGIAPGMILRMTILRAADARSPNAPDRIEFPPAFAQAPHWKGELGPPRRRLEMTIY
jgi:hypothetical protein